MNDAIVFYDASCPLCSRVVRFILKNEKNETLLFSSLQGEFAKSFFMNKGISEIDMSTFYFFKNKQFYKRSSAALRLIPHLKWFWFGLRIFWVFPILLRDPVYALVANNRYRMFKEKCDIGLLNQERNLDQKIKI
jgi:predicted DCC family thiol-disulfide oxidoreductase YuxK